MLHQIKDVPDDARYRMFIANTLMNYGAFDEAIKHLEEGLRASPKKQLLYYSLSQAYTLKGDVENGLGALRLAFEAETSNTTALKQYAAYAIRLGRDGLATEILAQEPSMALMDSEFINAYAVSGRFGKVAELWEYRIAHEDALNPQSHLSLAAAYVKLHKSQKAIDTVRKVMELAPDFKAQGEELIRQIRAGEI